MAVHLSDASYLTDPSKYVSVLLLSLRTMLQLEMPHVNVLSKMDIISNYGSLGQSSSFHFALNRSLTPSQTSTWTSTLRSRICRSSQMSSTGTRVWLASAT